MLCVIAAAVSMLSAVLVLDPTDEKYSKKNSFDEFGYLHQGTCLINLGRYDEAITRLLTAESKAPENSQYLPEIYQELAFAYSELKLPEIALRYIDKTENLDCDHIDMEITLITPTLSLVVEVVEGTLSEVDAVKLACEVMSALVPSL